LISYNQHQISQNMNSKTATVLYETTEASQTLKLNQTSNNIFQQ